MHLRQFLLTMRRVPQPPINPAQRPAERHDFWPPFIIALIALLVLVCGATHITNIETLEGNTASERQLVKSFTSGGLEVVQPSAVAPEPVEPPGDPAAEAKAIERAERAAAKSGGLKYRVNTGAANPCPT